MFTLSIGDDASRVKVSSGVITFSPYLHTNTHTGFSITATCGKHNPNPRTTFLGCLKNVKNKSKIILMLYLGNTHLFSVVKQTYWPAFSSGIDSTHSVAKGNT